MNDKETKELEKLLDDVLQETKFELYAPTPMRSCSALKIRSMYKTGSINRFYHISPIVQNGIIKNLERKICSLLGEFVNPRTKCVGFNLCNCMGGMALPSIDVFSKAFLCASASIGSENSVNLLCQWINGGPIEYCRKAILVGGSIDMPVYAPNYGISIEKLPDTTDKMDTLIPSNFQYLSNDYHILGMPLLSVDCSVSPAFFIPADEYNPKMSDHKRKWAQGKIKDFYIGSFCDYLSLSSNGYIQPLYEWSDSPVLRMFFGILAGGPMGYLNKDKVFAEKTEISQSNLDDAMRLQISQSKLSEKIKDRIGISTNKWIESKGSQSIDEKLINLRTSLESLYLKKTTSEIRFRMSYNGAMYLGGSKEERKENFYSLKRAYDISSGVIHGNPIKQKDIARAQKSLDEGQELCRRGIIKMVMEGRKKDIDFDDVIFGI